MQRAKWNDKFITDFQRKPAGLGKSEVMGVGGNLFADETGQGAHMAHVSFVAHPPGYTDWEIRFVDWQPFHVFRKLYRLSWSTRRDWFYLLGLIDGAGGGCP